MKRHTERDTERVLENCTWRHADEASGLFAPYIDAPIPDHANCVGMPNRYDYADGLVTWSEREGVFGWRIVSVCPLCGQWWHHEERKTTRAGVVFE